MASQPGSSSSSSQSEAASHLGAAVGVVKHVVAGLAQVEHRVRKEAHGAAAVGPLLAQLRQGSVAAAAQGGYKRSTARWAGVAAGWPATASALVPLAAPPAWPPALPACGTWLGAASTRTLHASSCRSRRCSRGSGGEAGQGGGERPAAGAAHGGAWGKKCPLA